MRRAPGLRLIGTRATALGGVATIFGVIGHVQAGGSDPNAWTLAALWLGATLLSLPFLIGRVGLLLIAALLLGEQILVHVGLMALVGMPAAPMADMPGMAMPMPSTQMSVFPSTNMLLAHAAAALIAGLWLWRGECALWSLLSRVAIRLRFRWLAPIPSLAVPGLDKSSFERHSTSNGIAERLSREVPRRGPPLLAAI